MKVVWSAVLALAVAGSAYADDDDEAKTPARTYTQAEVEALVDLATRVVKLEEFQQDAELEKLKAAAAKEKQDENKGLPDRISALEKKMGSAGQTWDASKMLTFSTPDGNFTAKIGGRLYFVYRHIFDRGNNGGNAVDSFIVDTARFQLDGTFYKDFYYRIEGEAKSGENTLAVTGTAAPVVVSGSTVPATFRTKDAYMGWSGLGDWVGLQAGQFKAPISQEETCSSRFIDFAERSLLNRIVPGHVTGVMLKGALVEKTFEWYMGYMNGAIARDSDRGTVDTNDEKDFFFRLFVSPFKTMDIDILKTMRVGVDYARGKRDTTVAAPAAVSSGDLGLPGILSFNTPGGVTVDGLQSRQNYNFSWNYGPAAIKAEYAKVVASLQGAAALHPRFIERACYVQATYLITGEEKVLENRVKPKNNFDPLAGGWGAWEVAVRWAQIDNGNGKRAGIVTAGHGAGSANERTNEITFGINWWMTPNVRMMIDWEHLSYEQQVGVGRFGSAKKTEDEVYIRWQIDF